MATRDTSQMMTRHSGTFNVASKTVDVEVEIDVTVRQNISKTYAASAAI